MKTIFGWSVLGALGFSLGVWGAIEWILRGAEAFDRRIQYDIEGD